MTNSLLTLIYYLIRRPHRGTTAVARLCFTTSPPYRYLSSLSFLTSRDPESLAVNFLSSYLLRFLGSKYLGGPQKPTIYHGSGLDSNSFFVQKPSKCEVFLEVLSFQTRKIRHFKPPRAFQTRKIRLILTPGAFHPENRANVMYLSTF